MGFSFVATCLLAWTLYETRKIAQASVDNVKAALDAANVAALGLKIAEHGTEEQRRLGEAQVRCYLHIPEAFVSLAKDGCPIIKFAVKNTGQSPAINFVWLPSIGYFVVALPLGRPPFRNSPSDRPDLSSCGADFSAGDTFVDQRGTYFPADPTEMEAISTASGLMASVTICAAWRGVFGNEFTMTRNFKIHIQNGRLGEFHLLKYMTGRLDGPTDPKPYGDFDDRNTTITHGQSAP